MNIVPRFSFFLPFFFLSNLHTNIHEVRIGFVFGIGVASFGSVLHIPEENDFLFVLLSTGEFMCFALREFVPKVVNSIRSEVPNKWRDDPSVGRNVHLMVFTHHDSGNRI